MIEHATNLSELSGDVRQTYFYKAPIPLLIGNLPFGDDFKEKRDEYEYLEYYILPSNIVVKYDGFLFYSKFLKNYMFLSQNYASWSFMYPIFYSYDGPYALNPFVNDTNGTCAWSADLQRRNSSNTNGTYSSTKIYYNFTTGRYEKGLGEDTFNVNGTWHPLGAKNLSNGYYDNPSSTKTGSMHFSYCTTLSGLRDFKYDSPHEEGRNSYIADYQISVGRYFAPDTSVSATVNFSNLANRDNLDKAYKEIAISDNFKSVFPSYAENQGKFKLDESSSLNYSDNLQYFYERLDLIKDLDHEDEPHKYEKICGIYENNSTKKGQYGVFALGSIVIGNEQHRDDIGWFIGVNSPCSNIEGFFIQSSSGQDLNRIQATNVISILRDDALSFRTDLSNFNLIITLGYSWKSEEKKYLVYYVTRDSDQDSIYRRYRLYIVDKDPSLLFSQRKLWYADLPVDETGWSTSSPTTQPPELFRYPFYFGDYGVDNFTDLEFNYINLDDENDTKEPVKFNMLGAVRENAQQQLLGFSIPKQYMGTRSLDEYKRTDTYIGYWDAPIVNFVEEK
jgi:hypothetical protein